MKAKLIPGTDGRLVLDYNSPCPFEAENDFEEALLHYLHKISVYLDNIEGATIGNDFVDNAVEVKLYALEETLSTKLDAVIEELRLIRKAEGA